MHPRSAVFWVLTATGAAVACVATPSPSPLEVPAPKATAEVLHATPDAQCATAHVGFENEEPASPSGGRGAPQHAGDTCGIADDNIAAAERAILGTSPAASPSAPTASKPWDHASKLQYLDVVERRFRLSKEERTLLDRQGFVVAGRLTHATYAWALHELYQSEMPLYVSVDAVLHAIYASNDRLLADLENGRLRPLLEQVVYAMHCALADAAASYPPEVAKDLDVYLTVARSLLSGKDTASLFGADSEARALVAQATDARGLSEVSLFGRARVIDFSQYTPRGHYADGGDLERYFRAAMWLSRLELNLVSRSSRSSAPGASPDPRETPREAVDALALSDLAERAHAMEGVAALDHAWGLLAGKREDVSLADLARLRREGHVDGFSIPASADALRAAIGSSFQRSARTHYMPEGSAVLPAITTLLGPRIVPDAAALRPLAHDEVPDRHAVHVTDVAYALGHDRAKQYLTADLATFPSLAGKLEEARRGLAGPFTGPDLYSAWLGGVRGLSEKPSGALPSFMKTSAYEDLRMNSAVAGYGQMRHNYVLMAAEGYDAAGCEIPDGYVEPAPATYAALRAYAVRGASVLRELDPKDTTGSQAYFTRLGRTLEVLAVIARDELAGRALSAEEKRFLSMVVEIEPAGTGSGPTYTGWYFDLFRNRDQEGLSDAGFIADYFTSGHDARAFYAGASLPRLGFFVVDTGGSPRLMVGPVAAAYEADQALDLGRVDDQKAATIAHREPWAASYTVAPLPEPPLAVTFLEEQPSGARVTLRFALKSTKDLGRVTLELLGHHRVPLTSITHQVGTRGTSFVFTLPAPKPDDDSVEAMRLTVGAFETVYVRRMSAMGLGGMSVGLGGMTTE